MTGMTELEALAQGLSVVDGEGDRETPESMADRMARHADELAAIVEGLLRDGAVGGVASRCVVSTRSLEMIRDAFGELHVEADELAHAWRVHESKNSQEFLFPRGAA
jgi:hypothetical protein